MKVGVLVATNHKRNEKRQGRGGTGSYSQIIVVFGVLPDSSRSKQ